MLKTNARMRVFLLGSLIALLTGTAHAGTITVNSTVQVTNPAGNGDGQCSLGEAIRAANTDTAIDGCAAGSGDDVIILPAGTHTLTAVSDTSFLGDTGLPAITSNITISGAGSASTIIERDLSAAAFRIFLVLSPSLEIVTQFAMLGVGVRNGFTDSGAAVGGGGIYSDGAFSCTDCLFANNESVKDGGAISIEVPGSLVLSNTVLSGNIADGDGGAVFISCSPVQVADSTFVDNVATTGRSGALDQSTGCPGFGGALIERSFFSRNTSGGIGGASVFADDNVIIRDSYFLDNATGGKGGAVYSFFTFLEVTGSTFQANTSGVTAGALAVEPALISNSTFVGNFAADEAGAILFDFDSVTLSNVTITGNSVGAGGTGGGGIVDYSGEPSLIRNSIIAGNSAEIGPDCLAFELLESQGHNIFGDATDCGFTSGPGDIIGSAAAPVDSRLLAPAANGGRTAGANLPDSGFVPIVIPSLAPQPDSPAIDAGDPATPGTGGTACEATDQRGVARPQGPACDIGAFELGEVVVEGDADLVLLPLPAPVASGNQLLYTAAVRNDGPATATSVVLSDTLSGQLAALSAAGSQGGACAVSARSVSCPLGTLASGAMARVTVTASILGSGWGSQTFSASADQLDPDPSNNLRVIELGENQPPTAIASAPEVVAATGPNGALVTLDGGGSSDPDGDTLTYRWSGPFPEGNGEVAGRNPKVTLPLGASRVSLVVSDGGKDSPPAEVTVTVTGFSVAVAPSVSVAAGSSADVVVTLSPQHGPFERPVQLSCADLPVYLACSFAPAEVTPNSSSASAVLTLRASTMAAKRSGHYFAAWAFGLPLLGLLFARTRRVRAWMWTALLGVLALQAGCAGSVTSEPPTLTVRINVTAKSGQLTHSSSLTVNVQR